MLKIEDLIKDLSEEDKIKYMPMFEQINIADFTKCIAQFSGITVSYLKDDVIKDYLLTWAKNKYRFFKLLGDKVRWDTRIDYIKQEQNIKDDIIDIAKDFPIYASWLYGFNSHKENKINKMYLPYFIIDIINELFPYDKVYNSSITHFFKSCLNAPDELVTRIGRIFENQTIEANYTISIDPVDIMLASENPYGWTSCYRLELGIEDSHADGCLAAVLDTKNLITYIWNKEGEFTLYNKYKFKNIRYKRMREFIAISDSMLSIHFNDIYPNKYSVSDEFFKQLRDIVETKVSEYLNISNKWMKASKNKLGIEVDCFRENYYGYNEFNSSSVFINENIKEDEEIPVYDVLIKCPCGECRNTLPDNDSDDELVYTGNGFTSENFYSGVYCEYIDDYCSDMDCTECRYYRMHHPLCPITGEECDCMSDCAIIDDDGEIVSSERHCGDCPIYKEYHQEEEE